MEKQSEQQDLKDIIATKEDGFGYCFKVARDEQNLSVADVANKLHLDKKIIVALENEDYTQLPAATFVCGYIRNYAKFLNISSESLIEYYKNERSESDFEPKLKITQKKSPTGQSVASNIFSSIISPIITLLVLLALAWGGWEAWTYISDHYFNSDLNGEQTEIENSLFGGTIDDNDTGALSLPEPGESYIESSSETYLNQSSGEINDDVGVATMTSEASLPVEIPVGDSLLVEDSLSVEDSIQAEDSTQVEDSIPTEDSSPTERLPAVANNMTETASGLLAQSTELNVSRANESVVESQPVLVVEDQLTVEFFGNSWVSIKDANGKILATGLKKSPKILQLEGKTPYKVFLGDARVVKVSFNGKRFDHSGYINKKNVARFNVK